MSSGPKKDNRGGAREGAGRKTQTLSARQVSAMLSKAEEYAKKHGKTVDDILLTFIYDEEASMKDRLPCIKIFKEYTTPKIAEGGEADQTAGPAVYLPEQRPVLKAVK